MKNYFEDVRMFRDKFSLPIPGHPTAVTPVNADLRADRAIEEVEEYRESNEMAFRSGQLADDGSSIQFHKAGILDALVDQMYILVGTILEHGMEGPFDEAWARVHQANMSKERVSSPGQSRHGSTLDLIKPEGWQPPSLFDLV